MRKSICTGFLSLMFIVALIAYPAESATITVCASGCDYTVIKDAVNNASPGDAILIGAGTYVENSRIEVTKNLTLIGAGASSTLIKPNFNTAGQSIPSTIDESFFYVAPDVTFTLKNVTIDGAGWQIHLAIQSRGTLMVEDCILRNIRHSKYYGRGISIYSGTQNLVKGSTFVNIERISIFVRGSMIQSLPNPIAHIEGNTIVGKGNGDYLNYGIELGGGGQATILNNHISDCQGVTGDLAWDSAGILATTARGLGTKATIYSNTIINSKFGIAVGNAITDTSSVEAHCNTISGNLLGIRSRAPIVYAENNWWNSPSGPYHGILNPLGTGDPVTDFVIFNPWLSKEGCTPPKAKSNPTYPLSMLPAAVTHISEAHELLTQADDLSIKAKTQGKDTTECEILIEEARLLLKKSQTLLTNPIRANNLAMQALEKLRQALECLEALLG